MNHDAIKNTLVTDRKPRKALLALGMSWFWFASFGMGLIACNKSSEDAPAAAAPPEQAATAPGSPDSAAHDDAAPPEAKAPERLRAPRIESEPEPAGAAGPVELPIAGAPSAAQLGGVAATETLAALAYRVEAPGESCLDSLLERCHQWFVVIAPRDASGKPAHVLVGESDTPSGMEVEALFGLGERLVTLVRDGRYTGDTPRLVASFIDPDGSVAAQHDLLPGASQEVRNATAAALDATHAVVCWSGDDARRTDPSGSIERLRERRIWCRRVGAEGVDDGAALLGAGAGPHRAPAVAFRDGHGLLAWVRNETLEVLPIDDELRPRGDVAVLGPATPRQPAIVPGHGGFLVVWQDPRGGTRAQRLEFDTQRFAAPLDLGGHGVRFVLHGGVAAVPQGFLVAGTPDDWTRLVLVDPRGESATLLSSSDDKSLVLLGPDSLVDLTPRRRKTRFVWRLAASLLRERSDAAATTVP